jgi:hypothetical protein
LAPDATRLAQANASLVSLHLFQRDDRISTGRHGCPCANRDGFTGLHYCPITSACPRLTHDAQRQPRRCIRRANRIAIHRSVVKWWQVVRRYHRLGKHTPNRLRQRHPLDAERSRRLQHYLPRFLYLDQRLHR